uniref:Vacuolar protein sorting-associated protein 13 VPS13 adaptor binding domain-containing protein n=1 Tax=Kalanchoe fedtschenkoi TaxID=63787 RepID=A0A7N0RDR0_KALFE
MLAHLIRRRLLSLLRPWLVDHPDMEVNLGFLRSNFIFRNLRLDAAVLNRLLDDPRKLCFKDVTVGYLAVHVSNWSVPFLAIEVGTVRVELAAGELRNEEGVEWRLKPTDTSRKEFKKILAEIDYEASALHDFLERICGISSRNCVRTAVYCLLLKHSHLKIHDVQLHVQFPSVDDSLTVSIEAKEFLVESEIFDHRCLLKGLVAATVLPGKDSYHSLDCSSFEIRIRNKGHEFLLPLTDISAFLKVKSLQVATCDVFIPNIKLSLDPTNFLVLEAVSIYLRRTYRQCRSGRQLWKLARRKVSYLLSTPRIRLHQLVLDVCQWLVYVNSCKHLLLQVGYPVKSVVENSSVRISRDKKYSRYIKLQWKVISDIEDDLPAEAVIQALQVARYKASWESSSVQNNYSKLRVNGMSEFPRKLFQLLHAICNYICYLLRWFLCVFQWKRYGPSNTGGMKTAVVDSFPFRGLNLNVRKVSITIFPMDMGAFDMNTTLKSQSGISQLELVSFCLVTEALLLRHSEGICEHSLYVCCGTLKIFSSVIGAPVTGTSGYSKNSTYLKGHKKVNRDVPALILDSEPAKIFHVPDNFDSAKCVSSFSVLQHIIRGMCLNWNHHSLLNKDHDMLCLEDPFFLFEIRSSIMESSLSNPCFSSLVCALSLGKMNLTLGFSSIVSVILLLRQVIETHIWTAEKDSVVVLPQYSISSGYLLAEYWGSSYNTCFERIKMAFQNFRPSSYIQLGMIFSGFCIKLPSELWGGNNDFHYESDHLAFEIQKVEVAIWPTSKSDFTVLNGGLESVDQKFEENLRMPPQNNILNGHIGNYESLGHITFGSYLRVNGISCKVQGPSKTQQHQLFALDPVNIELSVIREHLHSFSSSIIAFSAALTGVVSGFCVFICMDQLQVLSQVIVGIHSAASYSHTRVNSLGLHQHPVVIDPNLMLSTRAIGSTTSGQIIPKSVLLAFTSLFDIKSVYVALHNSINGNSGQSPFENFKELNNYDLPDCGICVSIQQLTTENSIEEDKAVASVDLSGVQVVTFKYQCQIAKDLSYSEFRTHILQSNHCIYELNLAKLTVMLRMDSSPNVSSSETMSKYSERASLHDHPFLNGSSPLTCILASSSEHRSETSVYLSSNCLITMNFLLSEIFITPCLLKMNIRGANQSSNFISSISSRGASGKISGSIKGGSIFLEVTALGVLFGCFASYFHFIMNILSDSGLQFEVNERSRDIGIPEGNHEESTRMMPNECQPTEVDMIEELFLDLSRFSLVILNDENTGCVQELVLEVDSSLKFEVKLSRRVAVFNLSRVSISSQFLHLNPDDEVPISRLSAASSDSRAILSPGDTTQKIQSTEEIGPAIDTASCSSDITLLHETFGLNFHSCILDKFGAIISVEMPSVKNNGSQCSSQVWAGSGSISGCDLTITITEIKMLLFVLESFSEVVSKITKIGSDNRRWLNQKETWDSSDEILPDGAIVAIQDVQQHMYVAVETNGNKYNLRGVIHYSLVGERALFRVKYHQQRKWSSDKLWFSLISIYAKAESGEPLRLNYQPGSGFVNISSANDKGWALWKMMSYNPEGFEADPDWEPYNQLGKKSYSLVNKKNNCSVAFIEGVPEFVPQPGNSFKFKVIQKPPLDCHDHTVVGDYEAGSQVDSDLRACAVTKTAVRGSVLPSLDIKFEKVSLTVYYELSEARDKLPLLQGCVDNIKLVVQLLESKIRVIGSCTAMLAYFNAQRNLWNELVPVVDVCLFYRSNFPHPAMDDAFSIVPGHLYLRFNELHIKLSELSLDVLLLICGELELAGPFSIKKNVVLANCCKVENQTSVNIICHFSDHQHITLSRRQSASIYLRQSTSASQPEKAQTVSIRLAFRAFSTTPIRLSLNEDQTIAWRTRVVSHKDTTTYPGPFVVIDILRKSEDGLTALISPLMKIHNETSFTLELRFQRPQQKEADLTTVLLKPGDIIDDSVTVFDASNSSGGAKRALTSLAVGNFLLSFRPQIMENLTEPISSEWSDDLEGGKAVKLSGLFDKLRYKVRKAVSLEQVKRAFATVHCSVYYEDTPTRLHFLIQRTGRDVPITNPGNLGDNSFVKSSPVALQEQRQIFILPTLRVSNLLQSEIHVLVTETDPSPRMGQEKKGNQATIQCESTADFYANPARIFFTFTISKFDLRCKTIDTGDWLKKLNKQKKDVTWLDISLDFDEGKYFATLRLYRGHKGILEAAVFTPYTLKNDSEIPLFFSMPNQKSLLWSEIMKFGGSVPLKHGFVLQPRAKASWIFKSNRARLRLCGENAVDEQLDLDALSGLTEISLRTDDGSGSAVHFMKFGVTVGPSSSKVTVQSQTVTVVSRYLVVNESKQSFMVRQCFSEENILVRNGQCVALQLRQISNRRRRVSIFDNLLRKHGNPNDVSSMYIQFQPSGNALDWSGPVCIASLGRFFLKFRKIDLEQSSNQLTRNKTWEFAVVHIMQEGSTFVLRFQKPPTVNLPYKIENNLRQTSVTFYQKDSSEPEILGSESSTDYVWDDLTRPHKLVIQINDMRVLREINLDKVRPWKPFSKSRQNIGMVSLLSLNKKPTEKGSISYGEQTVLEMDKVGYEVYADGPTRILKICEYPGSQKQNVVLQFCTKYRLRLSSIAIHFVQHGKQDSDATNTLEPPPVSPIIVARIVNTSFGFLFTNLQNYYLIRVQSLNVDEKWVGAPFAAVIRRHQSSLNDAADSTLRIAFIILSSSSNVKQIKYGSVLLQPIDLNLDEETLMKVAPFWRASLSNPNTPSRQFYFAHFEIHPIKVVASFLPGDSYASYNSTQETLRTLLHSVIKIPTIKNMTAELNGILITHALITRRELFVKCAQHYSWYAMRAIYIAKGSPLLPPSFASVFDDLASSSLDIFFDPSHGLISIPGLTVGTFKLLGKCIDARGMSGTKRYFGDLGKTIRTAGSNVLFAAVTEVSDSVLKGAEASGVNGMVTGFHQGILRLAMEPSILGHVFMEGGPDRKIKLDRSPGVDELYIEGYLQAMLDTLYRQEYLRVRVIEDQVVLKNLPPNTALIDEIMERVKGFLVTKALLKGDSSTYRPLRQLRAGSDWKIGPTVLTLCEHLFVSFAIRMLRKQTNKLLGGIRLSLKVKKDEASSRTEAPSTTTINKEESGGSIWKWGLNKFVLSGMVAYIDGRLCRHIPNPIARRIVSGFLLSFLDNSDNNSDKNKED